MVEQLRTFQVFCVFVVVFSSVHGDYYYQTTDDYGARPDVSEHPGGTITDDSLVFYKSRSPYVVRNDLIVERNARVVFEPGVELRFEPQVGITVRGILTAEVRR